MIFGSMIFAVALKGLWTTEYRTVSGVRSGDDNDCTMRSRPAFDFVSRTMWRSPLL